MMQAVRLLWALFLRIHAIAIASVLALGCGCCASRDAARIGGATAATRAAQTAGDTNKQHGPDSLRAWIGKRYVDLPAGAQSIGGDTLTVRDTVYGTEFFKLGSRYVLWLAQGRGTGDSGAAEWTVISVMELDPAPGENVFTGYCRIDKKRDPAIIAVGFHEDLPVFSHIRRALRISVVTRSFDEIPTTGVDCLNPDTEGQRE